MDDDRVCASAAKYEYNLTERDLQPLDCVYKRNPYYGSAAPMRLYCRLEVQELAEQKQAALVWEEEHAEEIEAQRVKCIKQAKDQAKHSVQMYNASTLDAPLITDTALGLPIQVWSVALTFILNDTVRGVYDVASDLYNLKCAGKAVVSVAQEGFRLLAEKCPALPADISWSTVVGAPLTLRIPELKAAARQLNLQVGGTKAILVARILHAFGLRRGFSTEQDGFLHTAGVDPAILRRAYCEHTIHPTTFSHELQAGFKA
jgi:SAP domain/XPA protein C-terminus